MTDLIDCITLIKSELQKIPPLSEGHHNSDMALNAMVETLSKKLPRCRIKIDWNRTTVSIAGIRATCTGGIEGGLNNWITAARRKLDRTGWIKTTGEKENVR